MKTFPIGGIHPPQNKLTAEKEIRYLSIPESVTIPFAQHIGAPAVPIISKGDYVKAGAANCNQ